MAEAAPSSAFLRFLRAAMEDIGSSGSRGFREGAETGAERGLGIGGNVGAYGGAALGGMMGAQQDDATGRDVYGSSVLGGLTGMGAGAGAGAALGAGLGGARGSARAMRVALQRILSEGRSAGGEGLGPRAMAQPMRANEELEQLIRLYQSMPDDDPRKPMLAMRIQQLSGEGQLDG